MPSAGKMPEGGYSARFRRLLREFPRADGEPWRGVELERETAGIVSASYVSALRRRRFSRPGLRRLEAISEVMGFPVALWWLPPEDWDEELDRHPERVGLSSLRAACRLLGLKPDPYVGILVPPPPVGEELAGMVRALFDAHPDPETGRPRDEEQIAAATGTLAATDVRRMRTGGQKATPRWGELRALSGAFGVPVERWFSEQGRPVGISVSGVIRSLEDGLIGVRCAGRALSTEERRSVAGLMRMARRDPPEDLPGGPVRERKRGDDVA